MEELYNNRTDPHLIKNLASAPEYFQKLAELRQAHLGFVNKYGDLDMIPETELFKKHWPGTGVQSVTEKPVLQLTDDRSLKITSPTVGALIEYKWEDEKDWNLYIAPLR